MQDKPPLWLRSEHKLNEARTAVTPNAVSKLLNAGYKVAVEHSDARAFSNEQYAQTGCDMVAEFSWQQAPLDNIIIGLKELSTNLGPFKHKHVHFAHVYKNQEGWKSFLQQFIEGTGTLFDLEYLVDENGRRIAAFGYWAGYVGAATALLQWAAQQTHSTLPALAPWESRDVLAKEVKLAVQKAIDAGAREPDVMVIGAKGRSGGGAVELCKTIGLKVTQWDQAETQSGGPFDEILQHAVMINCVFLNKAIPPFTSKAHLDNPDRQLSVISDVSCDPFSEANPLPIYSHCTSMDEPALRIIQAQNLDQLPSKLPGNLPLDIISIDHLPSLLPVESSEEFSDALLPYLLNIDQAEQGVWHRAAAVFKQKCALACTGAKNE